MSTTVYVKYRLVNVITPYNAGGSPQSAVFAHVIFVTRPLWQGSELSNCISLWQAEDSHPQLYSVRNIQYKSI